jgi:hypothetical protein
MYISQCYFLCVVTKAIEEPLLYTPISTNTPLTGDNARAPKMESLHPLPRNRRHSINTAQCCARVLDWCVHAVLNHCILAGETGGIELLLIVCYVYRSTNSSTTLSHHRTMQQRCIWRTRPMNLCPILLYVTTIVSYIPE